MKSIYTTKMSVKVRRSSIEGELSDVFTCLNVEPSNFFVKKDRYRKKQEDKKIVYCYSSDSSSAFVHLPLSFCHQRWGLSNDSCILHAHVVAKQKKPLYDYQIPIVQEALKQLSENKVTLIKCRPGSGKTYMSLVLSIASQRRTVVLIENLSLIGQWRQSVEDISDHTCWVVGEEDYPSECPSIIVCHVQRYSLVPSAVANTVGFMILDECPRLCNQQGVDAMNWFTPSKIVGLSATPSRSRDGMFTVMEHYLGKKIVDYSCKIPIKVDKVTTSFKADREASPSKSWAKYIQSIMYNEVRNEFICDLSCNYLSRGYKMMLLTTEKNHVTELSRLFAERGVVHDTYFGKKKKYVNSQLLIANTQKASIGFDEKSNTCDGFDDKRINCVVFCSAVASKENIIQAAGRGFRSSDSVPIVVHIVDDEVIFRKHFATALRAYSEEDYKVTLRQLTMKECLCAEEMCEAT